MRNSSKVASLLKQCLVCLAIVFAGEVYAQDMSEVYQLNPVRVKKRGASLESQTLYFNSMGITELQNLRTEHFNGTIDESSFARMVALEEVLSPVMAIHEKFGQELSQIEFKEAMRAQKILMRDQATAFKVFEAIGPERASLLAIRASARALQSMADKPSNDVQGNSLLNLDIVAELLELTDDQRVKISDITKEFTKPFKKGSERDFDDYDQLLSDHWEKLLSVLKSEQRSSAIRLIGSPVNWFRAGKNESLRRRDFVAKPGIAAVTGLERVEWGAGVKKPNVYQMSRNELDSVGIRVIPSSSFEMFRSNFVWDELELTDDQREKMKQFNVSPSVSLPRFQESRLSELLNGEANYPIELSDVLLGNQLELFQQVELQVLTGVYEGSVGLAHPQMLAKLQVSKTQQSEIDLLVKEFESKARVFYKNILEAREASKVVFKERLDSVLNANQKEKLRRLQKH